MPRVLVFGAGAIGAVYCYVFSQAGAEVTAVCRSNYDAAKQDGFEIFSHRFGHVRCRPEVVRSVEDASASGLWDFIVICAKSFPGTFQGDMIHPAVGPSTVIALLQNGISTEEAIAAAFPENPILSCVVNVPATQIRHGVIDNGSSQNININMLQIGTYPGSAPVFHKQAAKNLASLVQKGGGDAEVYDDIQPKRWEKLIVNAAWSPIAALSLCNDVEFRHSSPRATDLVRNVMYEVVSIAQALGIEGVDQALADNHLKGYLQRTIGKEPSMLADVRNNRPFEVEAIVGNAVRLARTNGVKVPLLDALYALGKGLYEAQAKSRRDSDPPPQSAGD